MTIVFRRATKNIQLLVHGDDFLVLADQEGQEYMKEGLSKKYERRCGGTIGEGSGDRPNDSPFSTES